MKNLATIIVIFLALFACQSEPMPEASNTTSSSQDLKTAIVGRWDTSYVLISMKSINNSDVDGTMEVQPHKTEDCCDPTKVHSVFREDGTYLSEYRDANKKLVIKSAGKWSTQGKTLILNQEFPKIKTLRYEATFDKNYAEFRSTVDFDLDGQDDDQMYFQIRRSGC
ncbi:MAG TPA: hypothetical protein PKK99_04970 [Bacteroidia bacterium]|nr:hypothetical protein [Bacteroidia bacterium]HNP98381.1 hypothetical protein [Bacteroidia bacterium]